ncbi:MAG TPA: hypothetical protein VE907_17325 [Gammaproteobacteria bacterium]|nr:hypothetical protein [Gammaproteobacteria bacterium]
MSSKKNELRREYSADLIKSGVRGKYAKRIRKEGANIVVIDPDLTDAFPNAKAVNDALRELLSRRERETT